ncbi:MAG: hypothetical protein EXS02_12360 [Planctomycetes bacterium]|nr:hypothetical protein [Planctomycetota bacterium]
MTNLNCLLALLAFGSVAAAQQAIVPNPLVFAGGGTTANVWRAGINRVQEFYDSTNLSAAGLGYPISINNIEWNLGAVLAGSLAYPAVQVYVSYTALGIDFSTPSTTFATNRSVALPTTPNFSGAVTAVAGSAGSWFINMPLTVPFTYDSSLGRDLLVELVISTAPVPLLGASTTTAFANPAHLCNSVRSVNSIIALTGAVSPFCPILRLGYSQIPGLAANLAYGSGCGSSANSFYQQFALGATSSLVGNTVSASLNLAGGYDVSSAAGVAITAPTLPGLALGDDQVSLAIALPFSFEFPGGTASAIYIDSNGRVNFSVTAVSNFGGGNPLTALLTPAIPAIGVSVQDLEPDGILNVDNVFAEVNPSNADEFLVTWVNVHCFGSIVPSAVNNMQLALINNGTNDRFELRYSTTANDSTSAAGNATVGFSRGSNAVNGGSQNLVGISFSTSVDSPSLQLAGAPRPILGTTTTYTLSNIKANTGVSSLLVSFASTLPVELLTYGFDAPGCFGYIDLSQFSSFGSLLIGSPTGAVSNTWPADPVFAGVSLYLQGIELAPAVNAAGLITSNGVEIKLGTV